MTVKGSIKLNGKEILEPIMIGRSPQKMGLLSNGLIVAHEYFDNIAFGLKYKALRTRQKSPPVEKHLNSSMGMKLKSVKSPGYKIVIDNNSAWSGPD